MSIGVRILSNNLRRLNSNLLLLYTGIQRNADAVASNYVHKLSNEKEKNCQAGGNQKEKGYS